MTRTALILLLLAGTLAAQNRGGRYSAIDYAFGQGQPDRPLRIDGGPYVAGSNVVITIDLCDVPALDGNSFCPLATNDPVQIGSVAAGNLETETPSAVSCPTPTQVATCTITVNLTYNHTSADTIRSSTYGLQEAANYASLNGGGLVVTSPQWASAGGTQAMINAASLAATVYIEDLRGSVPQYWWPSGVSSATMIIVPTKAALPSGVPTA